MSRAKAAILGSVSSQVYMIINMLLGIVVTPFLLKFLDKEEYGLSTVIFQLVGYFNMFDFGLGNAVARNLAAHRGDNEESKLAVNRILSTSVYTYSVIGLLVILMGASISPFLPNYFNMHSRLSEAAVAITLSLSISIGVQFPLRAFYGIFYAHQKQIISNSVGFLMTFLNLILPVIFLYFGYGLWSFVYTNIVCSIAGISSIMYLHRRHYNYVKIRFAYFDKPLLKSMFNFGFYLFLSGIAYQVIFFTDRFFIGSLVSLSAVTLYSVTAKAPEFGRELIFKITDNVFPAMVEISSKDGEGKLREVHQKLLFVTSCCFTMAFWIILILNVPFLLLWVGEGFFAGNTIFLLSLALLVLHTIVRVSGVCLTGAGLVKGFSLVSVLEAGLNVGLTLWLGKMLGVSGILLATIIAGACTGHWYIPYTAMKFLKIKFVDYLKVLLIPAVTISSFGIVMYWISQQVFESVNLNWITFFAIALITGFLFAGFSWLVLLRKEFAQYVPPRIKKYLYITS